MEKGAVQCCLLDVVTQELIVAIVTCSRPAQGQVNTSSQCPRGSINWTCWVTKKERGRGTKKI